jgi:hypothetical protein
MVVPDNADLKKEIVQSHHDSGTAGHPGREKTLDLVTRDYWWTSVTQYIHKYVDGCEQCQHSKTVTDVGLQTQIWTGANGAKGGSWQARDWC